MPGEEQDPHYRVASGRLPFILCTAEQATRSSTRTLNITSIVRLCPSRQFRFTISSSHLIYTTGSSRTRSSRISNSTAVEVLVSPASNSRNSRTAEAAVSTLHSTTATTTTSLTDLAAVVDHPITTTSRLPIHPTAPP